MGCIAVLLQSGFCNTTPHTRSMYTQHDADLQEHKNMGLSLNVYPWQQLRCSTGLRLTCSSEDVAEGALEEGSAALISCNLPPCIHSTLVVALLTAGLHRWQCSLFSATAGQKQACIG